MIEAGRLADLGEPPTPLFNARAAERRARGERILSLGLGEPSFPTPPHIVEAACEALRQGHTRYSSAPGLPELRTAIAEKLALENGLDYRPDEILVTPGAKNALHLALTGLLRPGDEVVAILPCYPSYAPLAALAGPGVTVRKVVLDEDGFRLSAAALERAFSPRTRVLIYNSPHNPTGRVFRKDEVRAVAEVSARHDCIVVSDEIYEALCWGGVPHVSPASFPGLRERTVVINGFSKAFGMTGWRIGYLAAPRSLAAALARIHAHINTNTCTFVQRAAVAALRGPRAHLERFHETLRANAAVLARVLGRAPALKCPPPEGGMFAFVDIRATGLASEEFCARLLERTGVAATAGIVFGAEGRVRISLAGDPEETALGLDLFAEFARDPGNR